MPAALRLLLLSSAVSLLAASARPQEPRARAGEHWAFQPVVAREPAPTGDARFDRHPIDRFVRGRLQAEGLRPAPRADRRTLIRRLSFDLLGLPPTPEEIEAFVADPSPDAWPRLVDRLLDSPHYGERQARDWLDLARYSDSNGLDENLAYANAFRYRDYVVRSFAADKPYDDFVQEQIAGDLLPPAADRQARFDQWTATGFLALGPKMLAEQDKRKLVLDIADEQIDLVGRTFLGLTLGCARCHDHKFDPVPARDYYALAGIFVSTSTMENLAHVSRWRERPLATAEDLAARQAAQKRLRETEAALTRRRRELDTGLESRWQADLARYLLAAREAMPAVRFVEAERFARSNLRVDRKQWGSAGVAVVHSSRPGLQFAEYEVEVPGDDWRLEVRYAAQESRPMRLLVDGRPWPEEVLAEPTGGWLPEHQRWQVVATFRLDAGRHVLRFERDGAVVHLDKLLLLPKAGWPASPAGLDAAVVRQVADYLQSRPPDDPVWAPWLALPDLPEPGGTLLPPVAAMLRGLPAASARDLAVRYQVLFGVVAAAWQRAADDARSLPDPDQERLRQALLGSWSLFSLPAAARRELLPEAARRDLAALEGRRRQAAAAVPPPPPMALCVQDGEVEDLPVYLRGNHLQPGSDPVPRGTLHRFDDLLPPLQIGDGESGRLQLARWITDPRHPLTARVIANRIWQQHFGRGLVPTPSNFGLRGEPPSHPGLLDWLAAELVRGGWSLKALHRTILLSETWCMASTGDPAAAAVDPDNRLLWRQNRRRLQAEAVRDAMLAVSGNLDRTLGGSLLEVKNRGYVTNDQSANQARYRSHRRSLYLPVIRNAMYDLFTAFDYNDPSVHFARRPASVVPHQALLLLNSPLVLEQARALAERARREATGDTAAVERAYRLALGRGPTPLELRRALDFLETSTADDGEDGDGPEPAVWTRFCQALLSCNEFLYID